MAVIVVPVDPPREGLVLPQLADSLLTRVEAVELYSAMARDVLRVAHASGGDLLVNVRDEATLPDEATGTADGANEAKAAVRALAATALDQLDDVRFERQVGSTREARVGNTVTHLIEREEENVLWLEPTAPLVARTDVDSAAMKLRRFDVVVGPATAGRVYATGFTTAIDFAGAYDPPELTTLARRCQDEGLSIDFLPLGPRVETEADLVTLLPSIEARRAAGRMIPVETAAAIDELDLAVEATEDGSLGVTRAGDQ